MMTILRHCSMYLYIYWPLSHSVQCSASHDSLLPLHPLLIIPAGHKNLQKDFCINQDLGQLKYLAGVTSQV